MNTNIGNTFVNGRPQPYAGGQASARPQHNAANEQPGLSRDTATRTGTPGTHRTDLDLSDKALTRRDIPRGSIINIVT